MTNDLIERLENGLKTRDCSVCDGYGTRNERTCGGCRGTGRVKVHWAIGDDDCLEAAAALRSKDDEIAELHNGDRVVLPQTLKHARNLYTVAVASLKSFEGGEDIEATDRAKDAEIAKLREALKPFAEAAEFIDNSSQRAGVCKFADSYQPRGKDVIPELGIFRRARTALGGGDE